MRKMPAPVVREAPAAAASSTLALAPAEPTHLRIPAIGVDADFEAPLGVQENGEIEVPKGFTTVGWYKYGPTPGELGPAVVLGHVDSYQGPQVFYRLRDLQPGDTVEIDRSDGTAAVFQVERLLTVSQDAFPTQEVYGNIDYAGLRLITCTGVYDHGTRRYDRNLVVFAKLISEHPSDSA
jgi:sortase (surface protein transpeptidase)